MKAVCAIFACLVALVAGAPWRPDEQLLEEQLAFGGYQPSLYRQKRSGYPYYTPCAAAAAHLGGGGVGGYPLHHGFGHGGFGIHHPYNGYAPHYRSDETEETTNVSDMDPTMSEHMPMSRYAYGGGSLGLGAHGGALGLGAHASGLGGLGGGALGVFPNAYMGGYSIPLLFTCAPSVATGHVLDPSLSGIGVGGLGGLSAGVGGLGGAGTYRDIGDNPQELSVTHEEPPTHQSLNPSKDSSHMSSVVQQ